MALIYQLAEGPEEICAQILQACSQCVLEKLQESERTEAGELGTDHSYGWNLLGSGDNGSHCLPPPPKKKNLGVGQELRCLSQELRTPDK